MLVKTEETPAISPLSPPSDRPKIKKRKYSRKGCKECKRRKIKCDEASPACQNCSRLNKTCVYDQKPRFSHEEYEYGEPKFQVSTARPGEPLQVRFYDHEVAKKQASGHDVQLGPYAPTYEPLGPNRSGHINQISQHHNHELRRPYGQDSGTGVRNAGQTINNAGQNMSQSISQSINQNISQNINQSISQSISSNINNIGYALDSADHKLEFLLPAAQTLTPTESGLAMSPNTFTSLDMQTLFDEASVLVHDMNYLIGPDLADQLAVAPLSSVSQDTMNNLALGSNTSPLSNTLDEKLQFRIDDFSAQIHEDAYVSPLGISEHLLMSNLELIDRCIAENSLVEPHLTFLRTVTNTDLLYHLYPFALLVELNEAVKLLLTYSAKCPYLLTSLLAILATFQFNQTGKLSHDRARQKYITVCFKALSDAFTEHSGFKNSAIFASNIEKLLLTVLVLTSYFTATTTLQNDNILNSWKAHLRGARDLLMNYSKISNSSYQNSALVMSGGLAFAKCWFFAIESSAGIHSPLGGTLLTSGKPGAALSEEDIFQNRPQPSMDNENAIFAETGIFDRAVHPEYYDALCRVNMVVLSPKLTDFHLYWGYTSKFVNVVLLLCAAIDTMRANNLEVCPQRWVAHIVALNIDAGSDIIVPQVSVKTFEVPATSVGHPDYSGPGKVSFPAANWVTDTDELGGKHYYLWFDASQQLRVDYLFLWMLALRAFMNARRTHPHVQELIQKMLCGSFFIKSKSLSRYEPEKDKVIVESDHYYLSLNTFDIRCIMIQSIFRLLSGLVVDDEDFEKIELYFMGLVKLGNGSSLNSLDILARFKENRRTRRKDRPDEVDDEIYDYYERTIDIPFA